METTTKILEEVRAISGEAIAKKQNNAINKYPKLIEQIKGAAALGKTQCEFAEHEIDEYSRRLLLTDGFICSATTKVRNCLEYSKYNIGNNSDKLIWVVSW